MKPSRSGVYVVAQDDGSGHEWTVEVFTHERDAHAACKQWNLSSRIHGSGITYRVVNAKGSTITKKYSGG